MTDEIERARLANDLMRQLDREVFCGQLHMRNLPKAIGIIEDWLAALSSRGDAPTFEELKEIPQLRELAKMITDNPCFTNAILAVTDAYKAGRASRGDAGTPVSLEDRMDYLMVKAARRVAEKRGEKAIPWAESALAHRETPEGGAPFAPLCQYCKQPLTPKVDCWACDRQSCTQCPDYRLAHREAPQVQEDWSIEVGPFTSAIVGEFMDVSYSIRYPGGSFQVNQRVPSTKEGYAEAHERVCRIVADREAKQEPEYRVSLDALDEVLQKFKSERAAWQKEREALRGVLSIALIPITALIVAGECTTAPSALADQVKLAIIEAHDKILTYFSAAPQPIPDQEVGCEKGRSPEASARRKAKRAGAIPDQEVKSDNR